MGLVLALCSDPPPQPASEELMGRPLKNTGKQALQCNSTIGSSCYSNTITNKQELHSYIYKIKDENQSVQKRGRPFGKLQQSPTITFKSSIK